MIFDDTHIPCKTMVLFFIADSSGGTAGSKIAAVNAAIAEVLPEAGSISSNNADAQIKIGAKWIYDKPLEKALWLHTTSKY